MAETRTIGFADDEDEDEDEDGQAGLLVSQDKVMRYSCWKHLGG